MSKPMVTTAKKISLKQHEEETFLSWVTPNSAIINNSLL